ncbi:integral membrane protein GPR155-like [Uloborus diversus]|uniref:integral membrane protein GPR155-like n=1 Tax=Uloborus diversus TaxID=327109 RepID=UPI0024097A2E|nr:integral membrane protein GPR155-like [Uloborus diversus]
MKSNIDLQDTLLPALVECFGIMLIGYILGKSKVLGHKEAKGLCLFVKNLALPSLIFVTISTISFTDVKWEFIAAVFVAKSCIFICVALMTILLSNPVNFGKAGIFAMAVTQSNDFALGYPLLVSLYGNKHPEFPAYLYIIAPIQLLVLNTVGFFFLEIENGKQEKSCEFLHVLKRTLMNPIVFATVIGMAWNLSYGQQILPIFEITLKTFSSSFAATALILVGYTMAEESEYSDNQISLTMALLVITKNMILPLLLQKVSAFMLQGSTDEEIQNFSSFGFLYGTIPTAPSVYVFALQYGMSVTIITKTIIGSTIVSAPLMFASASVISLSQTGIYHLSFYLDQMIAYLSSTSVLSSAWLLIMFSMGRRYSICLGPILQLVIAQFLIACGGILLFFSPTVNSPLFYTQYILTVGGVYATRLGAVFLSTLLFIFRWRSLCFILRKKNKLNLLLIIFCVILPFVIATTLTICKSNHVTGIDFQLGFPQLVTTTVITVISLSLTILFLILQHICFRHKIENNSSIDETEPLYQNSGAVLESSSFEPPKKQLRNEVPTAHFTDVEDLGQCLIDDVIAEQSTNTFPKEYQNNFCDSRFQCSSEQRLQCGQFLSNFIGKCQEGKIDIYDNKHIFKYTVLLIALCVVMTLSLSVCIWKLLLETKNGIYIELEYLDIIGNHSVGFVCFVLFGLESKLMDKIRQKYKTLFENKKTLDIYEATSIDICNHFMTFYYEKCKFDIGQTKILNNIHYKYAFTAADFVEWLTENGIIEKTEEAEIYGTTLLNGNIIEKINHAGYFSQNSFVFRFVQNEQEHNREV